LLYEDKPNGLNITAKNADLKANFEGNRVELSHADINVSKTGENIQANVDGTLSADITQQGLTAKVNSSGKHNVSVNGNKIDVSIDKANINADYDATIQSANPNKPKSNSEISVKVGDATVSGKVKTNIANISGDIKNGSVEIKAGKDISVTSNAEC
jgi:carbon monoxide dehydrogenase subunit G